MSVKKAETKFTVQFSRTDPSHLQVAEILNEQGRYGKAIYIASAIQHYINCSESPGMRSTVLPDKKQIGPIIAEMRQGTEGGEIKPICEEIDYTDSVEALGADGFSVVAGALEMFRKK